MSRYRFACQTITFGPNQREQLPHVMAAAREAGYEGVEMGFRHFQHLSPAEMRSLLDEHGLELAATHLGGNLEDPAQADGERSVLAEVLDYAAAIGLRLVLYSGLRYTTDAQFTADLERLNRSAVTAATRGITLAYHNHDWEFLDGARCFRGLIAHGVPELKLCPDLGWLYRAGVDPVSFLAEHRARLAGIHFKNYRLADGQMRICRLDAGIAPLREAARWLARERLPLTWVMAEQDDPDGQTADAAVAANARFLTTAFGA